MQTSFSDNGESRIPKTKKGYELDELLSALQKDIRRGNEYQAAYWGVELEDFNPKALWNRLKIIASEDIGLANSNATVLIDVLEKKYFDFKERNNDGYKLFLIHAIAYLARSPKSRLIDNLVIAVYNEETKLEIPNYALDKHTVRGRKMGRGFNYFFDEGAKIANQTIEDTYEAKARKLKIKN
jgi:replication-associated recombination protein RarA